MSEPDSGIYFGMPAESYHASTALSATGCKQLMVGPANFWRQSPMNRDKSAEEPSDAQILGTAFHKRFLEGRSEFYRHYVRKLDASDHPDAIDGMEALREYGAALGVKGRSIEKLCAAILEKDPDAKLWPILKENHAVANANKEMLSAGIMRRIEQSAGFVETNKDAHRALSDGYPEVSLFWEDDESGVRMKARLDYLKWLSVVDLKTFANVRGKAIDKAVADVALSNAIQPVVYCEGIEAIKGMLRRGDCPIHGEPEPSFMDALTNAPPHTFVFVFVESCAYPAIRVRQFARTGPDGEETLYWRYGRMAFRRGVETYKACMTAFGPSKPWLDEGPISVFQDTEFSIYATATE